MPLNTIVYLLGPKLPLKVRLALYYSLKNDKIVIKNYAIAINPADPII